MFINNIPIQKIHTNKKDPHRGRKLFYEFVYNFNDHYTNKKDPHRGRKQFAKDFDARTGNNIQIKKIPIGDGNDLENSIWRLSL